MEGRLTHSLQSNSIKSKSKTRGLCKYHTCRYKGGRGHMEGRLTHSLENNSGKRQRPNKGLNNPVCQEITPTDKRRMHVVYG
jgi:hypothetical protein